LEVKTPTRILMPVDRTLSSHVETDPAHASVVLKPFDPGVLSSRVKAAFRRLRVAG
jgi:DNA-binding response OmpR family regulator